MATPATTPTLAQAIRSKYPGAYDDIPDHQLEQQIIAKYPQYADMPRSMPGGAGGTWEPSTLMGIAQIKDPNQRGSLLQQQFLSDAKPIAQAAQMAVPSMPGVQFQGPVDIAGRKLAAGQELSNITNQLRNVPINTTGSLQWAQKAKELNDAGATLPGVFGKFLDRMGLGSTAPTAGGIPTAASPLTFGEGRNISKVAGKLSETEQQATLKEMKGYVKQFAGEIGDSLKQAAQAHGFEPDYSNALKEYHDASTLEETMKTIKKWGIGTILAGLSSVGAGYAIKKGIQLGTELSK